MPETKTRNHWRDPSPKWDTYLDKGCFLNESCINCSFRICWEDVSNKTKRKLGKWSTEEIKEFLLNESPVNGLRCD